MTRNSFKKNFGASGSVALMTNMGRPKIRKWYKYSLSSCHKGIVDLPMDEDFEDHEAALGRDKADDAYKTKEAFFSRYFFGDYLERLRYYDEFVRKHLGKEEEVLSIGSGRCANKLYLIEDGYNITCSDLGLIDCYSQTVVLFSGTTGLCFRKRVTNS